MKQNTGNEAEGLKARDIGKYGYFSGLSDGALEALASRVEVVRFPAGHTIVKEGETGDAFYFVKEGRLEVTSKTKSAEGSKLSVSGSLQGGGDMALLTGTIRSSSIRAITETTLFRLPRVYFDEAILNDTALRDGLMKKAEDYERINRIRTLQPFELLDPQKICAIMEVMTTKTYAPGEDIIVQGEKGDVYYIIREGRVAVLKAKKGGQTPEQVAELGEGAAFGEEALIRDDPRNATCRALEDTTVLVLQKRDFDRIVKSAFLENIFPEDISADTYLDNYVIIDARVPAEYLEEHIYGAENIPVEVLRTRCLEFDRSKRYITYCLNDSRGMVAAFLLKNRGFDAKCLRGGLSGWPGPLETGSDGIHMPISHD